MRGGLDHRYRRTGPLAPRQDGLYRCAPSSADRAELEELAVLATERGLSVRFSDDGRLLVDLTGSYERLPLEVYDSASLERVERLIAREAGR